MQSSLSDPLDHAASRRAMIDSQLRTSGVNADWALARMRAVPRETFLPEAAHAAAYTDRAIRLDAEHSMAAPLFYGMLLQEARPVSADRVLIVSPAPGYLAELVRPLVSGITTMTPDEAIAAASGTAAGAASEFTLLLIDGAAERLPPSLAAQMAGGGRAVGGVVVNSVQRLATGRVAGGELVFQPVMEMGIPRLLAFDKPKGWHF